MDRNFERPRILHFIGLEENAHGPNHATAPSMQKTEPLVLHFVVDPQDLQVNQCGGLIFPSFHPRRWNDVWLSLCWSTDDGPRWSSNSLRTGYLPQSIFGFPIFTWDSVGWEIRQTFAQLGCDWNPKGINYQTQGSPFKALSNRICSPYFTLLFPSGQMTSCCFRFPLWIERHWPCWANHWKSLSILSTSHIWTWLQWQFEVLIPVWEPHMHDEYLFWQLLFSESSCKYLTLNMNFVFCMISRRCA